MKLDIQKDLVSQCSYFKSRPDTVTLGGFGRGKPKILENP